MSQASISVPTGSGLQVRTGFNNALQAIATNFRGAAEPSPAYPGMIWEDTTASLVKQRNAANNAWYTVGTLDTANWGLVPVGEVTASAVANKVAKRDANGKLAGDILGNAATSTKLATTRSISATGDVTWSVNFDGDGNATAVATVVDDSHSHTAATVSGVGGGKQLFTTSGSFTVPTGVTKVWLTMCGGGGGGGSSDGSVVGGGGGAGGCALKTEVTVTPGSSHTVTVGALGAVGAAGGASSFGALLSCSGGGAGIAGLSDSGGTPGASGGFGGQAGCSTMGGSGLFGNGSSYAGSASYVATGYGAGGCGGANASTPAKAGTAGFVLVEW